MNFPNKIPKMLKTTCKILFVVGGQNKNFILD